MHILYVSRFNIGIIQHDSSCGLLAMLPQFNSHCVIDVIVVLAVSATQDAYHIVIVGGLWLSIMLHDLTTTATRAVAGFQGALQKWMLLGITHLGTTTCYDRSCIVKFSPRVLIYTYTRSINTVSIGKFLKFNVANWAV